LDYICPDHVSIPMKKDDFVFGIPIQVRFKDIDALGHVNNANHITYFEIARTAYFKQVVGGEIDWKRQGIILARTEIDYLCPVFAGEEVWVFARVAAFGNSSFTMKYLVEKGKGDAAVAVAHGVSVQVCYDYEAGRSVPVPLRWRERVVAFETAPVSG